MKNIIKSIFWTPILLLCLVRCSDDYLDVANPNEIDAQNFFQSMNDLELALTSVYSAQTAFELYGESLLPFGLYGMAKTGDQQFLADQNRNQFYLNEVVPGNGLVASYWRAFYRGIARANDFLANSEQFLASAELTEAQRTRAEQMRGEAYFLRAFDYFHLVRLWGEANPADNSEALAVPLILDIATSRDDTNVGRATVGAIYGQIISDLQQAETLLPDSWEGADLARADAFAAKAMLGQVRLYQEDYAAAQQKFEEVIDGPFSLVPFEEYDALFHGENEFSEESLFELNLSTDAQENTWQGGTGSNLALVIAPSGTGWSNNYPHDRNILRFGSDPRLQISALEPGIDTVTAQGGKKIVLPKYVEDEGALGWSYKKYVLIESNLFSNDNNQNYGANINIIRLADIYLMYAEVLNEQGNDALAMEYMNKVRRRAYGSNIETPNPAVDYVALAGTQLRDSIREERFRELFAEGWRWYDIKRWGIVAEELAKYERTRNGAIIFDEKDYYLPIPQGEIDINTAITQSEGY